MRVAVYYSNKDIRIEKKPRPKIGDGEILVKIEASGICGTDCLEWYRIHRVPLVLGHEIAGIVVEAERGVKSCKIGDRVAVSHHVPCGVCRFCLDGHETVCDTLRKTNFDPGGFSEYVRVPKINCEKGVYIIPKNVSFEDATFVEPLACVLRGQRLAGISTSKRIKDKTLLVIGSGISGILHIKLARLYGIKRIIATDLSPYRLKAAEKAGADFAVNAADYSPELADFVIICAGALPAIEQGLRSLERGGTVLFFAAAGKDDKIPVPINEIFWRNEASMMSSYAGSPADHAEALKLIASKKIAVADMITHRLGLDDTGLGFKLVAEARESMKVIIEPWR